MAKREITKISYKFIVAAVVPQMYSIKRVLLPGQVE